MIDFAEVGELCVKELLKSGGEFCEFYFERKFSFAARREDNRLEDINSGSDMGVGLRIIKNGRTYYGFTNKLSKKNLIELSRALVLAAKLEISKPIDMMFEQSKERFELLIEGDAFFMPETDKKIELLNRADAAARAFDERIRQVSVSLRDELKEVLIVNSLGEIVKDVRPRVVMNVLAVASDGYTIQTGRQSVGHLGNYSLFTKNKPEEIAKEAARRAVLMLSAKPAPSGVFTVVISSQAGGTMIHEAVGHGLEADLAIQGLSVYSGKIGKRVASPLVTVIDNGSLKGMFGSSGYDDEGVPTSKNILIEDGYLKKFMYDRVYSMKAGEPLTGNGRRQSYKHTPIPRMTNTFIAPGQDSPEDIILDTKRGILVKKMGGGQVNTVSGDFVFEVSEGYLIENGRVTSPIRGATLIGNGPKVMLEIDAVGKDLGFSIGICGKEGQGVPVSDGMPTIRIPKITVGGTGS